jgi:hypothetical protein
LLKIFDVQLRALWYFELRLPALLPDIECAHHQVLRRQREGTGIDLLRGIEKPSGTSPAIKSGTYRPMLR